MKRFTTLLIGVIAIGSALADPSIAAQLSDNAIHPIAHAAQTYQPPNNGGPRGTTGSGTR